MDKGNIGIAGERGTDKDLSPFEKVVVFIDEIDKMNDADKIGGFLVGQGCDWTKRRPARTVFAYGRRELRHGEHDHSIAADSLTGLPPAP